MKRLKLSIPALLRILILTCMFLARAAYGRMPFPAIEQDYATWYQWPVSQGGNDHWYGLIRTSMVAEAAEKAAEKWGGHLASCADTNELNFITQIAKIKFNSSAYRTALIAPPGQTYRWTDGTPLIPGLFSFANQTNTSICTNRLALTPLGGALFDFDCPSGKSYDGSLFEVSAHPSTLPAAIASVYPISTGYLYVENPEINSPGVAHFGANVFGPQPSSIQWKVGGVPIRGATNSLFDLPISTVSTGAVSVAVSNINGGEESAPIPLKIVPIMFTGTMPSSSYITETNFWWKQWPVSQGGNDHWYSIRQFGQGVSYDEAAAFASHVGAEVLTLQTRAESQRFVEMFSLNFFGGWLGIAENSSGDFEWVDGTPLTDVGWVGGHPDLSDPLATRVLLDNNGGWKTARGSDPVGSILLERTNAPADIKPFFLSEMEPIRMIVGATNRLQFEVIGGPPLSGQWFRDGLRLRGQTNVVLNLAPTNAAETGAYTFVISNSFGAATSAPVNVTVYVPLPIALTVTAPDSTHLHIEFDQPDDATETDLEGSADLNTWFGVIERWGRPGHHDITIPIDLDPFYPPIFYRVHRYP